MTTDKKIKVLTLSDHPLMPSGVGTQTRYMIEHLLSTGKYQFISLGGAIKHQDYTPQKTEQYGDDWIIIPVNNYGDHDTIRTMLQMQKPDILWFMTDPRFYGWLWDIENEIRPYIPMVYYHVWDNFPPPTFNKPAYDSNDVIVTISKVTDKVVEAVSPGVERHYLPHSVNMGTFKPLQEEEIETFRKKVFPKDEEPKFLLFFNSRNARRKQSGTLIWWFKEFLDEVGHDKARLLMHTDVKDPHGQDLEAIISELGLMDGQVMFSKEKVDAPNLSVLYNLADATVAISDAEGFGLSANESLACGTPIVVTMTGGLQEQVTDGKEFFGVGIEPSSKAIIGSQEVPFIYEDRISKEDFLDALRKLYNMTREERKEIGKKGRKHLEKNYNQKKLMKRWDELLTDIHERYGSWETRKGYERWTLKEIKR